MSYFEFPHTRNYDGDLGYIIKKLEELNTAYNNFFDLNKITFHDPINWDINESYKANTIVYDVQSETLYISRNAVPAGIDISNPDYWVLVSPFKIDTSFNLNSINPVANKTITTKINSIDNNIKTNSDNIAENTANIAINANSIRSETSNRITSDNTINARIDEIISGASVDPDAELLDIRIGAFGETYSTAGDAVRGQVDKVNDAINYLTESKTLIPNYRQGYLTTNGTYNTSSSGKSYAMDISTCENIINIVCENNNILRLGLYVATIDNVDSSSVADVYMPLTSPVPSIYKMNPSVYSDYKTLIVSTDYNNATPSTIAVYDVFETFSNVDDKIDTLNNYFDVNIISALDIKRGNITVNGEIQNSTTRLYSSSIPTIAGVLSSTNSLGRFYIYAWDSDGVFVGGLTNSGFVSGDSTTYSEVDIDNLRSNYPGYQFRFVYFLTAGSATLSDIADLSLTNVLFDNNSSGETIRIMFNNIGGFTYGVKGDDNRLPTDTALEKIEHYKQFYAEYQPDILALEEFPLDTAPYIDLNDSVAPNECLYPFIYPENTTPYQYAAIKSNFPFTSTRNIGIVIPDQEYSLRGELALIKTPFKRTLAVLSTVFDVNGTVENRTAQMTKAIELMEQYKYSIICVDTNMLSQNEFDTMKSLFKTNGYQVANGDFYPLTDTCPNAGYKPIDNIFVKGPAKIKSFIAPNVYDYLASDHLPIISDILFYD